jgi:hypothetical protein
MALILHIRFSINTYTLASSVLNSLGLINLIVISRYVRAAGPI